MRSGTNYRSNRNPTPGNHYRSGPISSLRESPGTAPEAALSPRGILDLGVLWRLRERHVQDSPTHPSESCCARVVGPATGSALVFPAIGGRLLPTRGVPPSQGAIPAASLVAAGNVNKTTVPVDLPTFFSVFDGFFEAHRSGWIVGSIKSSSSTPLALLPPKKSHAYPGDLRQWNKLSFSSFLIQRMSFFMSAAVPGKIHDPP